MKNDQERTELLQQIDKLLTAVDSMQTCLEAQEQREKSRPKVTLATSLLAGAEASEWQANKLKTNGDEAGARQASEHAVTLRRMASEAAVTERRQSMHLVPTID